MKYALAILVLVVTGCAVPTARGFDQQLAGTRGQNINNIISKLGPPANVYAMPNGDKIYTFVRSQTYRTPTTTTAQAAGGYGYAQGSTTTSGGNLVTSGCRIDFRVNAQQMVMDYRFEGDRCRAMEQE
jgi:hypothetical protein